LPFTAVASIAKLANWPAGSVTVVLVTTLLTFGDPSVNDVPSALTVDPSRFAEYAFPAPSNPPVNVVPSLTIPILLNTGERLTGPLLPAVTIDSVLPAVEVVMAVPLDPAATPLTSWIEDDVLCVVDDSVSATVATTPLEMVLELIPHSKHVELPALLVHDICLPAAVPAEPMAIVADVMSAVEYFRVHSSPAGAAPFKAMLNPTVVPGLPEPADTLSAVVCAEQHAHATETSANVRTAALRMDPQT
jgi:hypothetical protein